MLFTHAAQQQTDRQTERGKDRETGRGKEKAAVSRQHSTGFLAIYSCA